MPEPRDLPLFRWGEELRRHRAVRRAGRRRIAAAAAALAVLALVATLLWPPRPLLVWNATLSSPLGLYLVSSSGEIGAGDMVVAWAPAGARRLAGERHYLPTNVPLVKRAAAASGDRVCAIGEAVFINGRVAASRRASDRSGRWLPWWTGCRLLEDGDLFLLTAAAPSSFDGRYFGVTEQEDVIGKARLIWVR